MKNKSILLNDIQELLIENNRNIVLDVLDIMYAQKKELESKNVTPSISKVDNFKSYVDEIIADVAVSDEKIELLSNLWYDLMCYDALEGDLDELIPYLNEKQNNVLVDCYAFTENPMKEITNVKSAVLSNIVKFYCKHKKVKPTPDLTD